MFRNSAPTLSQSARVLRVEAIEVIAKLSQDYSQEDIDSKMYADVLDGEIVGYDVSELYGVPEMRAMCVGNKRVKLGDLSAQDWCSMHIQ